jgi:DNA-directed RNA polymerase subunit alpha
MQIFNLIDSVNIKTISEKEKEGVFEIEGLYTGYGITVGNALRRVLLSSLPGAAITQIKINGINHEFSTIPGVLEDVVELMLNFKKVRLRMHVDEAQTVNLKVKGEKKVTAADIETNANLEIVSPEVHIATITNKATELNVELKIEKGLGYVPVEAHKTEKLPIGVIVLDAMFSPVVKANFVVENMRVGDQIDYNRLKLTVETDGSVTPSQAVYQSINILQEHFTKLVANVSVIKPEIKKIKIEEPKKKPRKKKVE